MFVILKLVLRGKQRIDLALQGTVRRGGVWSCGGNNKGENLVHPDTKRSSSSTNDIAISVHNLSPFVVAEHSVPRRVKAASEECVPDILRDHADMDASIVALFRDSRSESECLHHRLQVAGNEQLGCGQCANVLLCALIGRDDRPVCRIDVVPLVSRRAEVCRAVRVWERGARCAVNVVGMEDQACPSSTQRTSAIDDSHVGVAAEKFNPSICVHAIDIHVVGSQLEIERCVGTRPILDVQTIARRSCVVNACTSRVTVRSNVAPCDLIWAVLHEKQREPGAGCLEVHPGEIDRAG